MFDIYQHTFTYKNEQYTLKPVKGDKIALVYSIINKFSGSSEENFLSKLDSETIKNLQLLIFETFKISYPDKSQDDLESFISQNFFSLIEPVLKVNISTPTD